MFFDHLQDAIASLEKANAELTPELLSAADARDALAACARAEKLIAYTKTALARRVDDAEVVSEMTGTSVGKAKEFVRTAQALRDCDSVSGALASGSVSLDQATEIVKAEKA